MTRLDLYTTVTEFDSFHQVKGEIRFNENVKIPYSAKTNRGVVTNLILLNEEKLGINKNIPEVILKNIKESITASVRIFLEKRNDPNKIQIPAYLEAGSFSQKMYEGANKVKGAKMVSFEVEEKEIDLLLSKLEKNPEKTVTQKCFASLACS